MTEVFEAYGLSADKRSEKQWSLKELETVLHARGDVLYWTDPDAPKPGVVTLMYEPGDAVLMVFAGTDTTTAFRQHVANVQIQDEPDVDPADEYGDAEWSAAQALAEDVLDQIDGIERDDAIEVIARALLDGVPELKKPEKPAKKKGKK